MASVLESRPRCELLPAQCQRFIRRTWTTSGSSPSRSATSARRRAGRSSSPHLPYREERHMQVHPLGARLARGPGLDRAGAGHAEGPAARVGADRALRRRPGATSGSTATRSRRRSRRASTRTWGRTRGRWMYHRMLERPDLMEAYAAPGVPRWERAGLPVMLPLMSKLIVRRADADDEHAAVRPRARARAVRRGRRAPRATAAPTCAGTPSAPPTSPSPRSPPPCSSPSATASALPPARRAARALRAPRWQTMREHPAGRFALRLYDQERP